MTALGGFIPGSVGGGADNAAITAQLSQYAIDYWPVHASGASSGAQAPMASALPVAAPGVHALAGYRPGAFSDDWYERIHVTPSSLALGNLVSSEVRTIEVWNAYRDQARTLGNVAQANAGGITVTAPGAVPMDFSPLQARQWSVSISTSGTPTINATLTWQFTGLADLPVSITGDRVTGWTLPPDWARGITETLRWETDLQQALNGSMDRLPLREVPRREWEFDTMTTGRDGATRHYRELLESSLAAWRGRVWALPVWTDQSVLATGLPAGSTTLDVDTTGLDFVADGLAMLHAGPNRYEVLKIQGLTATALTFTRATTVDFARGARLWPCRLARLTDTPHYTRANANLMRTTLRFRSDADNTWAAAAPVATYAGYPVLEDRPDESNGLTSRVDRQLVELDGHVGGIYTDDPTGLPWTVQGFLWRLSGRAERAAHRSLLYWLGGRAEALWLPSFADDLTLAADAIAGQQVMRVLSGGFTRFIDGLPGRRHIRIELVDGSVIYHGITAWAEVDADTEQLTLDAVLANGIARASVRQISFMALVHGASDHVQIDHQNTVEGVARCAYDFAGLPAEEPLP